MTEPDANLRVGSIEQERLERELLHAIETSRDSKAWEIALRFAEGRRPQDVGLATRKALSALLLRHIQTLAEQDPSACLAAYNTPITTLAKKNDQVAEVVISALSRLGGRANLEHAEQLAYNELQNGTRRALMLNVILSGYRESMGLEAAEFLARACEDFSQSWLIHFRRFQQLTHDVEYDTLIEYISAYRKHAQTKWVNPRVFVYAALYFAREDMAEYCLKSLSTACMLLKQAMDGDWQSLSRLDIDGLASSAMNLGALETAQEIFEHYDEKGWKKSEQLTRKLETLRKFLRAVNLPTDNVIPLTSSQDALRKSLIEFQPSDKQTQSPGRPVVILPVNAAQPDSDLFFRSAVELNRLTSEVGGCKFHWSLVSGPMVERVLEKFRPTLSYHTRSSSQLPSASLHVKASVLPPYGFMDRMGYFGWSSFATERKALRSVSSFELDLFYDRILALYEKSEHANAIHSKDWDSIPDEPYLFLPLQYLGAEQLIDSVSIDMIELVEIAVEWGRRNGRFVVVKRHPGCCSSRVAALIRRLEKLDGVLVSDAPMPVLLERAWVVVPGNSGVGMQAAIKLKPSIVTGMVDYWQVSTLVKSAEEFAACLDAYDPPSEYEIKAFLYDYFCEFCVDGERPKEIRRELEKLISIGPML